MELTAKIYLQKIQSHVSAYRYESDGLFSGKLAAVWQSLYQWQATGEFTHRECCVQLLGEIFDNLNNDTPQLHGASMSVGVAGFCYVVTMIHREGWLEFDLEETLSDLDAFLYESALELIEQLRLDFWHGAFGILFYFLERLPTPRIKAWAEELVQKIVDEVRGSDEGLWFPNILQPEDEATVNFSLSHGQTAFLLILMQAAKKNVQAELARSVVWRGVNFVLKYQMSCDWKQHYSMFPSSINQYTEAPQRNNRLALCYGDLNIALLAYQAADFLNNPSLREKADMIGLTSLMRQSEEATQVSDSHLCHGAAGVAQLYHTFYRLSGHQAYYEGYQYWIDKTIALLDHDLHSGAFEDDAGSLLNGYVGVSLVLLSYIYHKKERLDWEKVFLMKP